MNWRCGKRSGAMACMRRPGHTGDHQTAIVVGDAMGVVFWAPGEQETVPEAVVVESAEAVEHFEQALGTVKAEVDAYMPQPRFPRQPSYDGVRPTTKTLRNMYAGFDEGVHLSWGLRGHEILPLPMLDEIEAA